MEERRARKREHFKDGMCFLKWVIYAGVIGLLVGAVGIVFHHGIDIATHVRGEIPDMIWFLPFSGLAIVLLYAATGMERDRGTNQVLVAVREGQQLKLRTAPLIFISTILTHLSGGSAGREGAALQLGGSLAAYVGRLMRLDGKDGRVMVMCGMSAAFSALFGTPLTAAVFAMEVVSVGVMFYTALVPALVSALVAFELARFTGMHTSVGYSVTDFAQMDAVVLLRIAVLGLLCAVVSVLFCKCMHHAPHIYAKLFKAPAARASVGGLLLLLMTIAVGCQDYNGAGDAVIRRMLAGETIPEAFLMKILFTAVTLGAGFRGGEIVPALFTGCAFGTFVGPLLGLPHGFAGALGMAAVFCGATNCPLSSILLSYELFGGQGLPMFALACGVSYALSGYYGLYSEQKIVYSKYRPECVDKNAE